MREIEGPFFFSHEIRVHNKEGSQICDDRRRGVKVKTRDPSTKPHGPVEEMGEGEEEVKCLCIFFWCSSKNRVLVMRLSYWQIWGNLGSFFFLPFFFSRV